MAVPANEDTAKVLANSVGMILMGKTNASVGIEAAAYI